MAATALAGSGARLATVTTMGSAGMVVLMHDRVTPAAGNHPPIQWSGEHESYGE